jgi:hypothetical protein
VGRHRRFAKGVFLLWPSRFLPAAAARTESNRACGRSGTGRRGRGGRGDGEGLGCK